MNETHNDTPGQSVQTSQSTRRRTWTHDMPALRLGRSVAFRRARQQGAATTDAARAAITLDAPAPRFLRLIRLVVGVVLLGLAWAGILALVMLAQMLIQPITRQHIITHLLFDATIASAICLVGIGVIGCLIVGAFCVTLALTNRGWQ